MHNVRAVPRFTRRSSLLCFAEETEDTLPERLRVIVTEIHAARKQRDRGAAVARKYRPQPLDLSSVALSQELQPLLLKCARSVHESAATKGSFAKLSQQEKAPSLNQAAQCLEVLIYVGFEIVPTAAAGRGGGVAVPEYLYDAIEVASYQQHGAYPLACRASSSAMTSLLLRSECWALRHVELGDCAGAAATAGQLTGLVPYFMLAPEAQACYKRACRDVFECVYVNGFEVVHTSTGQKRSQHEADLGFISRLVAAESGINTDLSRCGAPSAPGVLVTRSAPPQARRLQVDLLVGYTVIGCLPLWSHFCCVLLSR